MTLTQNLRPSPRALVPVPVPEPSLNFLQRVQKFLSPKASQSNLPTIYTNTGPISVGQVGGFGIVSSNTALVRTPGAQTFRDYAATPWVFAAINKRIDQVSSAEWDIVPFDNTKRFAARQQDRLRELFSQPSAKLDSFQSFAKVVIRELLTLDAAPVEKVRYPDGTIGELWPVRGDWIAVDERWDGSSPNKPRYYWVPDGTIRATFLNEDMVYLVANQSATTALGISPIAVLLKVIESELQALEYNRRQVMGAAPDGVLNIGETAGPDDVQAATSRFQSEVFGQGAMAVIGGYKAPSWMPFRATNRDMQFREWEDLLIRCIAVVLGLSPMDLGITFDVNRSSAEQQSDNSNDTGLRPLKTLFQNFMTREIVWDKSFGGRGSNLAFKFADLDLDETLTKANINKVAMPGVPTKTINEGRKDAGRAPYGDATDKKNIANHLLTNTPLGMLDLTTGEYIGAQQLSDIQSKGKIDVATAVAATKPKTAPKAPAAPA